MSKTTSRLDELTPEQRRLLALRMQKRKAAQDDPPAPRDDAGGEYPLSFAQQRLWMLERLSPGGTAYNLPAAVRVRAAVDPERVARAVNDIVRRHGALRTRFAQRDDQSVQVVEPYRPVPVPIDDLSGRAPSEREAALARIAHEDANAPFNLEQGPPFRARVVRMGAEDVAILVCMHHIVSDGWSMDVFWRELSAFLDAYPEGTPPAVPPLSLSYGEHARRQRERLSDEGLARMVAWWRNELDGAPHLLELPTDHPRPAVASGRGGVAHARLDGTLGPRVQAFALADATTPFMVLLAAYQVLLGRYTGRDDLLVGTAAAGRDTRDVEPLIGFFANTVAVRGDLTGTPTFRDVVRRVHARVLDAFAHQEVPFERLVEELSPERSLAWSPLVQTVFLARTEALSAPAPGPAAEGAGAVENVRQDVRASKFDLTLGVGMGHGQAFADVEYATDLFDHGTAERLARHYGVLLDALLARPDAPIDDVSMLADEERSLVTGSFAHGPPVADADRSLPALFASAVRAAPEAVALEWDGGRMTYAALEAESTRLAHHLRARGARPGDRVGVMLARGPSLVAAMLATLKAGCAYVPLDPTYPAERLAFMLAEADAHLLIADGDARASADALAADSLEVVDLSAIRAEIDSAPDAPPAADPGPDALAYVLYTSGSTGRPKGVGVPHRAVARLVRDGALADFGPAATWLHLAPATFDAATLEVWAPLLNGGRLVLAPDRPLSPRELGETIRRHGVTHLWLTAGLFHLVADEDPDALAGVRHLLAGGDVLSVAHARRVRDAHPRLRLTNGYGPTENTTFTACHDLSAADWERASLPIGRPIAGTRAYVLDAGLRLLPVGVPGELYAGGDGLAWGYLRLPALTAERFVPDPFGAPGSRLYRTGDGARWLADGALEFLGRADQQVKVRGFRIETGEIEQALREDPRVGDAVVLARADGPGEKRLVAYVVPRDGAHPSPSELRDALAARLPAYMVPGAFVHLDALPLTANGKVDRRALPAPSDVDAGDAFVAPRTPTEEVVAGLWAELLGGDRVGAEDDFFALGGHSLIATQLVSRVRGAFGVELPLRDVFEAPLLGAFADRVDAAVREAAGMDAPPLVAVDGNDHPLSFAQERLWFIDRLEPGNPVYNMPFPLRMRGMLDVASMERALAEIVRRHASLRTRFARVEGRPLQRVEPAEGWHLPVEDLSALPADAREAETERRVAEWARAPFDLEHGPLFRARLLRLGDDDHVLLVGMHHVVSDGWSMGVFWRELTTLYRAFSAGQPSPLPEPALQYADFAVWQRAWLSGPALERQVAWWRAHLGRAPALLELPTDRPRPATQSHRGDGYDFVIPADVAQSARALARREGATLFMALLAAWNGVLSRWSGQDDVVVGTPVAGRTRRETEGLIGFFVNTLAIRGDLSDDPSFVALLGRVREATLGAYAHQDLPFERLVEELQPERSLSHAPLYQAVLVLQNLPEGPTEGFSDGLALEGAGGHSGVAKVDLTLGLMEGPGGELYATLEYATDLWDRATMARLATHFTTLLGAAAAAPETLVSALPLMAAEERAEVVRMGAAVASSPVTETLHARFATRAVITPDAPAVTFGERTLSYAELDGRANALARRLAARGAGPDVLVGLCVERSLETVVGILGILKAGAAYLPLDPAYPDDRLAYMLEDSGARLVLTTADAAHRLPDGVTRVWMDEEADRSGGDRFTPVDVAPDALAYVIYTSGSTGRPKGVQVTHANVVRLFAATDDSFGFGAADVWTLFHSYAFDFSVWELWGALLYGGRLVVVPFDVSRDPAQFLALLERERVTVLNQTPSAFRQLIRADEEAEGRADLALRSVVFGGEALDPASLRGWVDRRGDERPALVNMYGITETTVHVTWRVIRAADVRAGASSPIGIPLPDLSVHLLDRRGEPVPVGVVGEMHVGGAGVARGYLGRPALTAQRFVPDPFGTDAEARLYRSGDLARRLPDGSLEFWGRADDQVKVRGFRIELGEIESVLLEHPAVREAVVLARGGADDRRLVAWVVGGDVSAADLRAHLLARLPEYMVPSAFVPLDALPLTRNGKVDRRALPEPETADASAATEYAAPRTPTEEVLAGIWAELLGAERVGAADGFFELGGHSLLATRVISRVRADFGVEVPVRAVFEHPVLQSFAAELDRLLRASAGTEAPPIRPVPREGDLPLSFAQERLWFVDRMEPGSAVYHMPFQYLLRGALDVESLRRAFAEVVRRHEVLRTSLPLVDDVPVQRIAPFAPVEIPLHDLSSLAPGERDDAARRLGDEVATRAFDLADGPLWRAALVRVSPDEHLLFVTLHHVISDGWSTGVLWTELSALYGAACAGEASPLPELPIQYGDFAVWQRAWLTGDVLEAQLDYWRRRLAGAPPLLELPTDRARPAVQTYAGAAESAVLEGAEAAAVLGLARGEGATLFMVLLAAMNVLLGRLAGQDDVVVGTPIAGRTRRETEGLMGLFLNSLALRTDLSGQPTFRALLRRVREATLEAYAHQDLPFERILEEVHPERSLSHTPIFQVMLNLSNFAEGDVSLPGLEVHPLGTGGDVASKFDLTLYAGEAPGGAIALHLVYNVALFDAPRIREMVAQLTGILRQAADDVERPIGSMSLLTDSARAVLPDPALPLSAAWRGSVPALFGAHAARAPHALAVEDPAERWTYGELNASARGIARELIAGGVQPGDVVAIHGHRSAALVRALMGTLRAGAAFLVLDPAYPAARLAEYVRIARPTGWLPLEAAGAAPAELADALRESVRVTVPLRPRAGSNDAIEAIDAPPVEIGPDSLAYLSFTSGTTGKPKAVMGRHGSLTHFTPWLAERFALGADDRFSLLSGLAHDPLHRDVFTPLQLGASVVAPDPDGVATPGYLARWMRDARITIAHLTPAMGQLLADVPFDAEAGAIDSLRRAFFVGDVLTRTDVNRLHRLAPGLDVVNYYGSTETQRAVAHFVVPRDTSALAKDIIPVGVGIPDVQVLVRNAAGARAGVGEVGEMWMRSPHIGLGYLGDPELTAARFVEGAYRTGDLGRYRPDGVAEIAGRADQQVKIRGFRIEPGEIEAALRAHPAVRDTVVVARGEGDGRRLVAYVVAEGQVPTSDALRAYLKGQVPDYMVPAAWVFMGALPVTPNGKVDRRALPEPETSAPTDARVAPRTPTETALAEIWSDLLGAPVGANDDFFALGGHSLLATRLIGRVRAALGVELPLRVLFQSPTLAAMAAQVDGQTRTEAATGAAPPRTLPLAPADTFASYPEGVYPLSFAQQRLWVLMQLGTSVAYNVAAALRFDGPLDDWALERALEEMVRRHGTLRTRVEVRDGEPVQVVQPPRPLRLRAEEVRADGDTSVDDVLRGMADAEAARPFPLEGPFLRVRLLRAADDDHVLLWSTHHLVSDGWSLGVFQAELTTLYRSFASGEPSPLRPLPIQYGPHALRQRRDLSGPALDALVGWWKARLSGAPALLELPTDRPRPAEPTGVGGSLWFEFPKEMGGRVATLARSCGATPFMVMLATFQALLSRWSGQDDVVVGTPIANRTAPELEGLIGFFANTLAIRGDVSGDPSFSTLLERVREATLGAYEHQDVPFERLVEELNPARSLAHSPVFQVMLVLQNAHGGELQAIEGITIRGLPREREAVKHDLTIALFEHGETFTARIDYATALFDRATMERFARQMVRLLDGALAHPDAPLSAVDLLPDEERAWLAELNRTDRDFSARTALEMFDGWVARTPDAPALAFEGERLTFAQVDARARHVARALVARGVHPEARVGLCVERSAEMIVALLGILRAGAAYVPLDPAFPSGRMANMLADAGASLVLAQDTLLSVLEGIGAEVVSIRGIESNAPESVALPEVRPEWLAYVIYTSGSTGRPKGVAVEHRQLAHYVQAVGARLALPERTSFATVSTIAADLGHTSVFGALCGGGCLHVIGADRIGDAEAFAGYLAEHAVDVLKITPSHLAALMGGRTPSAVLPRRCLVLGGEASRAAWVDEIRALAPGLRVVNHYGPTETTVGALAYVADSELPDTSGGTVPVGRPLANARAYVLDSTLRPVPIGIPGELCIGGRGVARGYLGRPSLTAERFVADPFATEPGARMYRTGDRARRLADGSIEFLGRIDQQVKVRGFRVEPGEVESVLRAHPAVRDAAVVARPDPLGTMALVAYVVGAEGAAADVDPLHRHCAAHLPAYMVPAAFVPVDALPLTPNGKLDRAALPAPELGGIEGHVAPRTPTEELVAAIWAELLGRDRVGAHDRFFELGGHSLMGTRVISRVREALDVEVPLAALFEAPRLADFAARVDQVVRAGAGVRLPAIRRTEGDTAPLSFAQERLWFIDRLDPGAATYNMSPALRLRGPLDPAALEAALAEVVRRHEPLRTSLPMVDGAPVQRISPPDTFRLDVLPVAESGRDGELARVAEAWARLPFDLESGPLFRARLLRIAPDDHALLLGLHHAVSDGWSNEILLRELFALYDAFAAGRPSPLPPLPLRYADYAAWQREWLAGEELDRQLAWWRARLDGAPALLELPLDHPRPAVQSPRGASHFFVVPADVAASVRALARGEGATLFMTLLAAWSILLSRWSGQEDVVVGTPVAGRTRHETEGLIGLFVNTLALRTTLNGDPAFRPLLARVREATLGAFAHQDLPFERLVEELRPERSLGHAPVFQALFVLQNTQAEDAAAPAGLAVEGVAREGAQAKVDLALTVADGPDGTLHASLTYAASLFDAGTMEGMAAQLVTLLRGVSGAPDAPVSSLPLLDGGEEERSVDVRGVRMDATVHAGFEAQAARTPAAPALAWSGGTWTFAELDARADRVAARLRAAGAGPERIVAVMAEYGPDAAAALLGVLKSGAAYLPLDPTHPTGRLSYVLADSGAMALLATPALRDRLPEAGSIPVLPLDVAADEAGTTGSLAFGRARTLPGAVPESAAYVIYTSGSTGLPKAVVVPHAAAAAHLREIARWWALTGDDRVEAFAALTFDPSVEQILAPLLAGASVALRDPAVETAADYVRRLRATGVTVASPPTGYWAQLVADDDALGALRTSVRMAVVGGEAMTPERAARWYAVPGQAVLVNAYGPTEAVVQAAAYRVPPETGTVRPARVPIGAGVGGRTLHVLDGRTRPVPAGVPGELYVGGPVLARGYLGRPALTAERFVPDPFAPEPGARMYRTGDRVRRRADGALEFLGRADQQVKVRGFRIEPGEVEAVLRAHPRVRDAAVVARPDPVGTMMLVAYMVGAEGAAADADSLHRHCLAQLPSYMVPAAFVPIDALPLTPNGKLDRAALPAPEGSSGDGYVVPRDVAELEVARIWGQALGVPRMGANDDFFRLGGHSLLAVRMLPRIRERFGRDVPLTTLFQHSTVAAFAAALRREGADGEDEGLLVTLNAGDGRPPLVFFPPAGGTVTHYADLARLLGPEQPFLALQAPGVNGVEAPLGTMDAMVDRYLDEIRRVQPRGPYRLGGWSAGGLTAFETARRLRADGEEVALLAIVDSPPPDARRESAPPDQVALYRRFAASTVTGDEALLDALADELRALAPEERLAGLSRWIARHGGHVVDAELERVGRVVSVFEATARAVRDYLDPPPLDAPVVLFVAEEGRAEEGAGPEALPARWRPFVRGPLTVRVVPGVHAQLVLEPAAVTLADALREAISGGGDANSMG